MAEYKTIAAENKTGTSENKARTSDHNRNRKGNDVHEGIELDSHGNSMYPNIHSCYASEVIELPTDGRVEIVASRGFGKQVTSSHDKDSVTITLANDDVIRVAVSQTKEHVGPDFVRRCGTRIPHGPAVLDFMISGILFVYSFLLTSLLAYVRGNWKYIAIMMIWFLYIILRMNLYSNAKSEFPTKGQLLRRQIWHFTGISFSIIFMYLTLIVVFPFLIQAAFYGSSTSDNDNAWGTEDFLIPALKVSIALALLGMAARRSFHCGKILKHSDIIKSILLDNVDIFNLVETLGVVSPNNVPLIAKGSVLEISILIFCVLAFLVVIFEALVPYSLLTLDSRTVGKVRQKLSIRDLKEKTIVMIYPYSLLILNLPFLVLRLILFAKFNELQLAYIIKNITTIVLGALALRNARSSLKKETEGPRLLRDGLHLQRRTSV